MKSMTSTTLFITPQEFFTEKVKEGLINRKIDTLPQVETYLVGLLQHYMDARNLFDEDEATGRRRQDSLAELFLRAHQSEEPLIQRIELLKKLADSSLYISGFFGDSLSRKVVDIDYYADMGGAAYASLSSQTREDTFARVYREFSMRFLDFVEVLAYISQQSFVQNDESLLRLYERYLRTGSEMAREKLVEMGVMTLPADNLKSSKQN